MLMHIHHRGLLLSYAYINAAPNPVGVGQTCSVSMWVDYPLAGTVQVITLDVRLLHLLSQRLTAQTSTQSLGRCSDPTGIETIHYTPTEVGTYVFTFNYAGQTYVWSIQLLRDAPTHSLLWRLFSQPPAHQQT